MINFEKKTVNLQCCSKQAADMLRKQPCLVRTENLDNSLYTKNEDRSCSPNRILLYPFRFGGMGINIYPLV